MGDCTLSGCHTTEGNVYEFDLGTLGTIKVPYGNNKGPFRAYIAIGQVMWTMRTIAERARIAAGKSYTDLP